MRVAYVPTGRARARASLTSASKCKPGLHNLIQRDTRVRTFNFAGYRLLRPGRRTRELAAM